MAIDKTIKSNRLLQSRRYTQAALTDAQEAFTSVLDINSREIYAQASLLPTSSLPFSGSSQSGSIYAVGGQNLLKYWYQHPLTPSNVVSASLVDAWFFIDPSGSSVTPQIIQSGQQTNFISNKYADPTLTNADAQDDPAGYNVVVLVDGVKQNSANYQFDYKDGVLQFNTSAPTSAQVVKVTAYQYIGQTVDTILTNLSASISGISGSVSNLSSDKIAISSVTASVASGLTSFTIVSGSSTLFSINNTGLISGSTLIVSSITGSLLGTASYATQALSSSFTTTASYITSSNVFGPYGADSILSSSYALSASIAATASYVPASAVVGLNLTQIATGSISASVFINSPTVFSIISGSTTLLNVNTASVVTVTDLTVNNNLIVAGTASFTNVDNLTVKDKFILINSGSSTLADSGWITQYNAAGSGSAFYLEAGTTGDTGTYGRFAVAYDAVGTAQALSVDEYVVTAKKSSGAPPATPTWGGTINGFGNMYINSDNGEIYIYS